MVNNSSSFSGPPSAPEHHDDRRQPQQRRTNSNNSNTCTDRTITRLEQFVDEDIDNAERPRRPPPQALLDRQSSSATYLHSNCATAASAEFDNFYDDRDGRMLPPPNRAPLHLTLGKETNKDDNDNHEDDMDYYRIVYKGVVALLESPEPNAKRTGSYLSYGEIFGSRRSRRRSRSRQSIRTCSDNDKNALAVDLVLSGGYAVDAFSSEQQLGLTVDPVGPTPKRSNHSNSHYSSNNNNNNLNTETTEKISGFCFVQQNGSRLVEPLRTQPHAETGSFLYKVTASAPLPILTGPCPDAPRTKAVVLPGATEEISLRVCADYNNNGDDEVWFLRLSHRRGWIADRVLLSNRRSNSNNRNDSSTQTLIPVVQEILQPSSPSAATLAASDTHSLDGGGSSVWSGATGNTSLSASTATAAKHNPRRHRPPRRRRDASSSDLPRHVSKQLQQQQQQLQQQQQVDSSHVAPSSNVSVLSDDSSIPDQHRYSIHNTSNHSNHSSSTQHSYLHSNKQQSQTQQHQQPASPDTSLGTTKSGGSTSQQQRQQQQQSSAPPPPISFFLMRVTAPRGLKILDAPHFQVNNLIARSKQQHQQPTFSSHVVSQMESPSSKGARQHPHHSIFQTMSSRLTTTGPSQKNANNSTAIIMDANSQTRILPRGSLFEASTRMTPASIHQGSGLIKLSDGSGWAVVPRQSDLDQQYRQGGGLAAAGGIAVQEGEAVQAYQEVGSAVLPSVASAIVVGVGRRPSATASAASGVHSSFDQQEEKKDARNTNNDDDNNSTTPPTAATTWLRILARTGVTVVCPPPVPEPTDTDTITSPTSSRGSSVHTGSNHGAANNPFLASNESDVASSVGSGFLDAMFRSNINNNNQQQMPSKKKQAAESSAAAAAEASDSRLANGNDKLQHQMPISNTIPCGMFVEVEPWADPPSSSSSSSKDSLTAVYRSYARLRGGQGWLPLLTTPSVSGTPDDRHQSYNKPTTTRAVKPEFRYGSFWYRVRQQRGLRVRLGPSRRAPSIKSDDGVHFRFECGEFLRASETVTVFSDDGDPVECFAKLYRNRHVRLRELSSNDEEDYRSLAILTTQAEWVQVYSDEELYLEECAMEPRIERHKQGWRYNVVPDDGVAVRKGPSFAAEKTGIILFGGESVVVNERVAPAGDKITWLRMKDGQGWIHDVDTEDNTIMIAHSLRHRAQQSNRPRKSAVPEDGNAIAYNTIIQRLFHKDEDGRDSKSFQRNKTSS